MRTISYAMIMLMTACAALAEQDRWRLVREGDGVHVYTRDVAGSDMDEFKAVTVLDSRIEVISEIFRDGPNYSKWMADCIEARIVSAPGPDTLVIYHATDAPWPVSDRDVVVRSRVARDWARGVFTAYLDSLDGDIVPRRGDRVRITKLRAVFSLKVLDRERTEVTYTVLADPAGSIPAPVANLFARDNPHATLRNLARQAKLERYREAGRRSRDLPEVERYFRERGR